jgi:hypothetical protein
MIGRTRVVIELDTIKIKSEQEAMKLSMARVAKLLMPKLSGVRRQEASAGGGSFIGGEAQGVEVVCGITSEKNRPRSKILN